MFNSNSAVIAVSIPFGLAAASAAWLVSGAGNETLGALVVLNKGLVKAPSRSLYSASYGSSAEALANPLFALTVGPNALADVTVELFGIVRTPHRTAALVALNGEKADWLVLGSTREGVTLQAVKTSSISVETPVGVREVNLGEAPSPSKQITKGSETPSIGSIGAQTTSAPVTAATSSNSSSTRSQHP